MLDGTEHLECHCFHPEHTARFTLDLDERETEHPYPELYIEVMLSHYLPWWKRLVVGIKYIFGGHHKEGYFGTWTLRAEDTDRLISMVQRYAARWAEIRKARGGKDEQ